MPPSPVIDLHTHILPRTWPDWTKRSGYAGWIELAHTDPGCAQRGTAHMCQSTSVDDSTPKKFFREIHANCWDPAVRLADMDRVGVDTQVLSTVPVMFAYWAKPRDAFDLARLLNDHIASVCAASPSATHTTNSTKRFIGLGTIPLQDEDFAIRELERCVRDLKMPGIQIGTHVNGQNLDEPHIARILAHAATLNACVFIHPWDMMRHNVVERPGEPPTSVDRMARYWQPWLVSMPTETTMAIMAFIFGGILDRSPTLRACFAHGGGTFPGTLGRIRHGLACRPDLFPEGAKDPVEYLARETQGVGDGVGGGVGGVTTPAAFWVDSLTHEPEALTRLIDLFSARRVCLGSDYPFPLGEDVPGQMIRDMERAGTITADTRAALLGTAALEFLGLS